MISVMIIIFMITMINTIVIINFTEMEDCVVKVFTLLSSSGSCIILFLEY